MGGHLTLDALPRCPAPGLAQAGGIGTHSVKGYASRGKLPDAVTTLSDAASGRNNELTAFPPALPHTHGPH